MPPRKKKKERPIEIKYLKKKIIDQPALGLMLAKKETLEMAKQVKDMLSLIIDPFTEKKDSKLNEIEGYEKRVDYYQIKIINYVTKISQRDINEDFVSESFKAIYIVSELEEIADIVYNSLLDKALVWIATDKHFSDAGKKELSEYHTHIINHYNNAIDAFMLSSAKSISKLKKDNKLLRNLSIELKQKHFMRLSQNIPESVSTSENHMEVIGNLRAIHGHISNIIRILY